MQNHATVKDMQRHLRHSNPQTTLKHYAKVIPESLRSAVAALDAQITGPRVEAEYQETGSRFKQKGRSPRQLANAEATLPTVAS
jgi:hypothetical protein